jgi:thiamine phosphate synthase YjbQ (UPF0047 family)
VNNLTEQVAEHVLRSQVRNGLAYLTPPPGPFLVRVAESEAGIFEDLSALLQRLVPLGARRERSLCLLLGPRGDQVPFRNRRLSLGRWQRVLLLGFGDDSNDCNDCTVTLIGR